jgi:8-oxo-dGTP pyrophosphatase MutT (NUDIX family)
VSGITRLGDKVLIGKRRNVNSYEGRWELVPSGHLVGDPFDCILGELEEETGIPVKNIKKTTFLGGVYDPEANVYDLCFEFILKKGAKLGGIEYENLQFVGNPDEFNLIPTSLELLKLKEKII